MGKSALVAMLYGYLRVGTFNDNGSRYSSIGVLLVVSLVNRFDRHLVTPNNFDLICRGNPLWLPFIIANITYRVPTRGALSTKNMISRHLLEMEEVLFGQIINYLTTSSQGEAIVEH